MRVLVTRPAEDAAETVRRLSAMGHESVVSPVLEVVFADQEPIDQSDIQAWLATSRNGVRALDRSQVRRDLPLLAVGRSTAAMAVECGFQDVRDADGDVSDLVDLVRRTLDAESGALFHGAGKDVTGDLAGALQQQGFTVRRQVLYRAVPVTSLAPEAASALKDWQIDAALFFSARSAGAFARLTAGELDRQLANVTAICVSNTAAEALADLSFGKILVAERPNQDDMLALLSRFAGSNK